MKFGIQLGNINDIKSSTGLVKSTAVSYNLHDPSQFGRYLANCEISWIFSCPWEVKTWGTKQKIRGGTLKHTWCENLRNNWSLFKILISALFFSKRIEHTINNNARSVHRKSIQHWSVVPIESRLPCKADFRGQMAPTFLEYSELVVD